MALEQMTDPTARSHPSNPHHQPVGLRAVRPFAQAHALAAAAQRYRAAAGDVPVNVSFCVRFPIWASAV